MGETVAAVMQRVQLALEASCRVVEKEEAAGIGGDVWASPRGNRYSHIAISFSGRQTDLSSGDKEARDTRPRRHVLALNITSVHRLLLFTAPSCLAARATSRRGTVTSSAEKQMYLIIYMTNGGEMRTCLSIYLLYILIILVRNI